MIEITQAQFVVWIILYLILLTLSFIGFDRYITWKYKYKRMVSDFEMLLITSAMAEWLKEMIDNSEKTKRKTKKVSNTTKQKNKKSTIKGKKTV